jgi:hypothetical protein
MPGISTNYSHLLAYHARSGDAIGKAGPLDGLFDFSLPCLWLEDTWDARTSRLKPIKKGRTCLGEVMCGLIGWVEWPVRLTRVLGGQGEVETLDNTYHVLR